jgi:hypothetical protein
MSHIYSTPCLRGRSLCYHIACAKFWRRRDAEGTQYLYAIRTLWPDAPEPIARAELRDDIATEPLYDIRSLWIITTVTHISNAGSQAGEFADPKEMMGISNAILPTSCCDSLFCPIAFWRNLVLETVRVLQAGEIERLRYPFTESPPNLYAANVMRVPSGEGIMQITEFELRILTVIVFFTGL